MHNYCSYASISGTLIKHNNNHNLDKSLSLSLSLSILLLSSLSRCCNCIYGSCGFPIVYADN